MKYKRFIEENFKIDEPKQGKLVSFVFNKVQQKYYQALCDEYDIENKGLSVPIREQILKARREGFSSLILALFAADDMYQNNPTETQVISYKDDATKTFSKRYKLYIESAYYSLWQVDNPKDIWSVDNGNELVLKRNGARFYCGTASSRTAGRGGVLQKLLFTESAFYPDTEKMMAKEIIDGTSRQVDINSGWIFSESTANGYGNYYELMWHQSVQGLIRYKPRFYGWREFYTEDEFKLIASEFVDRNMLMQEYPETPEEAFISSGSAYFDNSKILDYINKTTDPIVIGSIRLVDKIPVFEEHTNGKLKIWEYPKEFKSYVIGGDTAEGLEDGDNSVLQVIDNQTLKTVAKFSAKIPPDEFALVSFALGLWYNNAYMGIEVNKDGLWVNTELFKNGYPNLYFREAIDDITNRVGSKVGFKTDERTRPYILSELQRMLYNYTDIWTNKDFLDECLTFVRNKMGRPEAMSGKHDDEIMSTAIAYEIRRNAPKQFDRPEIKSQGDLMIQMRLEKLYGNKQKQSVSQQDYF
jgi:hypothetical protein